MNDDLSQETQAAIQEYINNREREPIHPTDEYYEYGQTKDHALDRHTIMFLRLARIWNPNMENVNSATYDYLNVKTGVNECTGKVCLSMQMGGFVSPNQQNVTDYTDISPNPEDRTLDEVKNPSNEEKIPLTYPFIWVGPDAWCGYNYLPPLNSLVLIGFGHKHNAYILGFINEGYKECRPYLKPGEICMKGIGHNYIHNRWSNKLDLVAWTKQKQQDRDVPTSYALNNCNAWIRMDADNGRMVLSIDDSDAAPDTIPDDSGGYYNSDASYNFSSLILMPKGIKLVVGSEGKATTVELDANGIRLNGESISLNAVHIDKNGARSDTN